ncbi:insulin-like peptide receptor isoform X2 [Drosophila innubila]|uniref:insulin-like peptide receptor isoform X2 n=1 Tax=Drosophila innubila TaxID=198719 RepID=UPI00148CC509|nr:insulin-like peptide receptor isoform X2 [Drosophila innubila]
MYRKVDMWHSMLWLLLLWPVATKTESICESLEIRQLSDFEKLRNCSIVVGHVRIANLQLPGNVSLADLRCEVTEITDYLMIYRSTGLFTLESIFPKLRIIRGQNLLLDRYALTVYENRNLRELGLVELLRIQKGFIRIESNPMLCFVETVDWIYLLGNSTTQHFAIKHNKSPNHCPVCGGRSADYSYRVKKTINCWNMHTSQRRLIPPKTEGCPKSCGSNGCDSKGNCCSRNCITGCSTQNCTLCANFLRNGRCVDQCYASYELNKRKCVSAKECRQLNLIPLTQGYRCVDHCPNNHKPVLGGNGTLQCQMECKGVFHVKRAADLDQLQDCVTINGSLIIELVDIKEKVISALEQALDKVKEITGYLKVQHSAPLMSLSFLKNLDTIRGDELIENKYVLSVMNNYHLEHIWKANRQVALQRGTIFFHLNPRLCYDKILKLQSSIKSGLKISIADVSPNSNGERVVCGNSIRSLDPQVEDVNSTAVRIVLDYMMWDDIETLIGYSYHYMEAPHTNVTMYDGRHGCGHDNWLMDVSPTKNRRHVISNLKPYTQYAYFVKTLTRTDYHMQIDAYSTIQYFRTLPSKSSPVSHVFGTSDYSTQITVNWWPPRRPNGNITRYIVNYELHNLTEPEANGKNYANVKPFNINDVDCECYDLEPYYSGPQPEDENYYNKEQSIYEDALPDLIYVSRRNLEKKKEKFGKVKDFEDLIAGRPIESMVNSKKTSTTTSATTTTSTTTTSTTTTTTTTPKTPVTQSSLAADAIQSTTMEDPEIQYEKYRQYVEEKMRMAQDTDLEEFVILHDMPKCDNANASIANQLEQKCVVEEELSGISLSGSQLYYNLTKLQPNQYYRVSVRACVDGVINGCSNPATILVKTMSIEVEQFLNGN